MFFLPSHEKTPYAWVDVYFGPDKDAVHVIDKRTLSIVKQPARSSDSGFERDRQQA